MIKANVLRNVVDVLTQIYHAFMYENKEYTQVLSMYAHIQHPGNDSFCTITAAVQYRRALISPESSSQLPSSGSYL